MPYLTIVTVAVCATFYYRAAVFENENTLIWSGLSILISALVLFWLHWGWLGIVFGQIGLYVGITIFRILRKP